MTRIETRLHCPACLGPKMQKLPLGRGGELVLDYCARCGGIWFEAGEVQALRGRRPDTLWARVERRDGVSRARCHACHAHIDPDAERCPACSQQVRLACPACEQEMERARHGELTLDVCRRCKGVWFDHHELAAVWTLERDRALDRRRTRSAASRAGEAGAAALEDGADLLATALLFSPDLVFYGAAAAGHVLASGAEALGSAAGVAGEAASGAAGALGGVASAVGDAAASVFEALVDIVGGIFS